VSWLDEITRQLRGVFDAVRDEIRTQGVLPLLQPVAPYNRSGFMTPAVTIGGLVAFLVLSGVAFAALGTLLTALLALWMLLVEVFGFSIELRPFVR
jgi:hypothetical protein